MDLNWLVTIIGCAISLIFGVFYKATKSHQLLSYVPTVWTSLGILGTFVAIVQSLKSQNVNFADIDLLVKNIVPAFQTSIIGIIGAIVTSVIIKIVYASEECKYEKEYKQSAGDLSPELYLIKIYHSLEQNTKAMESLPTAMQEQIVVLQQEMVQQKILQTKFFDHFFVKLNTFYDGLYDMEKMHAGEITNRYLEGINDIITKTHVEVNNRLENLMIPHIESIYKLLSDEQAKLGVVLDSLSSTLNKNVQDIADVLNKFAQKELEHIDEMSNQSELIVKSNSENSTLLLKSVQQEMSLLQNNVVEAFKFLIETLETKTKENYDILLQNNKQYCDRLLSKVESIETSMFEERLESTKNEIKNLAEQLESLFKLTAETMEKSFKGMDLNMSDVTFALNQSSDAYSDLVLELYRLLPLLEKLVLFPDNEEIIVK